MSLATRRARHQAKTFFRQYTASYKAPRNERQEPVVVASIVVQQPRETISLRDIVAKVLKKTGMDMAPQS